MLRAFSLLGLVGLFLAGCVDAVPTRIGADGKPVPVVYRIGPGDLPRVQFRMLDSVNALRARAGVPPLQLNSQLNAAAATLARDMSFQGRPWVFGSDGASPLTRARQAGYRGRLMGELISETFETELETLAAWMAESDTRAILLDPSARDMGFAFHQDANGKLWWALNTGNPFETGFTPTYVPIPVPRGEF